VERWSAGAVAVTLGSRGALVSMGAGAPAVVPAPGVHCVDPCGAGDRFASAAAVALGPGALATEAVQEAVRAASEFVAAAEPRTAHPAAWSPPAAAMEDAETLARRVRAEGGTVVATGGCFDLLHAGHIESLRAARGLGDCLVVCLNSDRSVAGSRGRSVRWCRRRTGPAYCWRSSTWTRCWSSTRTPPRPRCNGSDRTCGPRAATTPAATCPRRGCCFVGRHAVVLPYLQGRSTTGLVSTVRALRETSP
jgi:cytidyltransferase-like protein